MSTSPHERSLQAAVEWIAHLEAENTVLREMVSECLTLLNVNSDKQEKRNGRIVALTETVALMSDELRILRADARRRQ